MSKIFKDIPSKPCVPNSAECFGAERMLITEFLAIAKTFLPTTVSGKTRMLFVNAISNDFRLATIF